MFDDINSPLAYQGVRAPTPPNFVMRRRDPTPVDTQNVFIGDFWLNEVDQNVWMLVSLAGRVAEWVQFIFNGGAGGARNFPTDAGVATEVAGVLNIRGDRDTSTTGVGNTVTIHLGNAITLGDLAPLAPDVGAVTATTGDMIITAGDLTLPATNAAGNQGIIKIGGNPWISAFNGNTFVGANSGNTTLTTAVENVGIGSAVLSNITTGAHNVAAGNLALNALTTGRGNVGVGQGALTLLTTGDSNVAVGYTALATVVTGTDNVAIGNGALTNLTAGASENTAIGDDALGSITTGQANTAIGNNAGQSLITGDSNNVLINHPGVGGNNGIIIFTRQPSGAGDQFLHTYGAQNIFVGLNSGNFTNTGSGTNVGVGFSALAALTSGAGNTAIGAGSLSVCTSGGGNIGIGTGSLRSVTSGGNNVVIGSLAGIAATTANFNVGVGGGCFDFLTTGTNNTVVGTSAASSLTTGNFNIAIGEAAGQNWTSSESSNIAIAHSGSTGETNVTRLGSSQTKCFIAGIRGVTTDVADAITVLISSTGQLGTVSSSARVKENIKDMDYASTPIMDLRPVTFNFISDERKKRHYGLIAEEADRVMPDIVIRDEDGQPETVKYHELPALLLNELQKLSKRVELLEKSSY